MNEVSLDQQIEQEVHNMLAAGQESRQAVAIFRVRLSYPRWRHQIKTAKVMLPGNIELDAKDATRPVTKMLPKEWQDKLQTIDTEKKRIVDNLCSGYDSGLCSVPVCNVQDFYDRMNELRNTLREVMRDLASIQSEVVTNLKSSTKERYGEEWVEVIRDGSGYKDPPTADEYDRMRQPRQESIDERRTRVESWRIVWTSLRQYIPSEQDILDANLSWSLKMGDVLEPMDTLRTVLANLGDTDKEDLKNQMMSEHRQNMRAIMGPPMERIQKSMQFVRDNLTSGKPLRADTRNKLQADLDYLQRFETMGFDQLGDILQGVTRITSDENFSAREYVDLDPEENDLLAVVSQGCDAIEEQIGTMQADDEMEDQYGEALRPLDLGD
jgi:hypothetical protein